MLLKVWLSKIDHRVVGRVAGQVSRGEEGSACRAEKGYMLLPRDHTQEIGIGVVMDVGPTALRVHMCVCVCACVQACVYLYVCEFLRVRGRLHVYVCLCMRMQIFFKYAVLRVYKCHNRHSMMQDEWEA